MINLTKTTNKGLVKFTVLFGKFPNVGGGRVAKCQGSWGLIPVKIFAGWVKKFGRKFNFAKSSLFGKIYDSFSSTPCKN